MKFFLLFAFSCIFAIIALKSISAANIPPSMDSTNPDRVRYDGYKVFKVTFTTDEQFDFLYNLKSNTVDLDFFQLSRSQKWADIMVPPKEISNFMKLLDEHGIKYEVPVDDVEKQFQMNAQ